MAVTVPSQQAVDEVLDALQAVMEFLNPGTSDEKPGEAEAWDYAEAVLHRHRPPADEYTSAAA